MRGIAIFATLPVMRRCLASTTLALAASAALAQAPCDVSLSVTPVSCSGAADGAITVVTGSGGPFTYIWGHDPNVNGATATGLDADFYAVTVLGPDGCVAVLDTLLDEPDILILGNTAYCPSNPPVLTATPVGGFSPATYTWSTGEGTPTVTYSAGFSGNVSLTAVDANGCIAGDLVSVTELPSPWAVMAIPDSLCQNVLSVVSVAATTGDSLVWRWGGFGFSNLPAPAIAFPQSGWQPISLQAFESDGCGGLPSVDSIFVRAQVPAVFTAVQVPCTPQVDIVLGSTADSCAFFIGDSLVTHACSGFIRWDFGRYASYGLTLYATQANNCNDTAFVLVDVRTEPVLYLANAFTPNEDGFNDRWPDRVDIPETGYELVLYDRWGRNLWSTVNPQEQWDAADVPMGTYVYTMKMRDPCQPTNSIEKVGHVTVFR